MVDELPGSGATFRQAEQIDHAVEAGFKQLEEAFANVEHAIVITHHPAFRGIGFPRLGPPQGLDSLLWDALAGNRAIEVLLEKHAERIPFIFSGHTHRETESTLGPARGYNIGGDYHYKRMLVIDWPARTVEVECDRPEQVDEAIAAGAHMVLLDNMSVAEVAACVARVRAIAPPGLLVEISGGITLDNVAAYAATGADLISSSAITQSAPALDLGLDLDVPAPDALPNEGALPKEAV